MRAHDPPAGSADTGNRVAELRHFPAHDTLDLLKFLIQDLDPGADILSEREYYDRYLTLRYGRGWFRCC